MDFSIMQMYVFVKYSKQHVEQTEHVVHHTIPCQVYTVFVLFMQIKVLLEF